MTLIRAKEPGAAWNTEAESASFALGSSYLVADATELAGLNSGATVAMPYTVNESQGSDFSLADGDPTTIEIANDVWASIYVGIELFAQTGVFTEISFALSTRFAPGNPGIRTDIDIITSVSQWWDFIVVPDVKLGPSTVPSFQVQAFPTTDGGTWEFGGQLGGLYIVRKA